MEGCLNASFLFYFFMAVKRFINVMPFVKVPLCQLRLCMPQIIDISTFSAEK